MDFAGEQEMEMEALQAILMDDLEEVTDSIPPGWRPTNKVWRVALVPQTVEGEAPAEYPLRLEVVFSHTPSYPEEAPLVKARGLQGLADADVAVLQAALEAEVEASLGMPMIYTLITNAQDWLQEKAAEAGSSMLDPKAEEKRLLEAEEARIAELRRHGHPVTPEAFAEWRARHEAQRALARAALGGGGAADAAREGRVTGKRWFQMQEEQHKEVAEPELAADEEDGEVDRDEWSEASEEGGVDLDEGSSDEDFAEEFLKERAAGG